jgi:purine nucleosidase/pyrimidine-specific ribonucleoside hydrolase
MRVVIDTDPGIDDALALLYAWRSPQTVVEAVTTVAGNVTLEHATTNLLRLLALAQPDPAPVVAAGAAGPLARALTTATGYHGNDGLGDVDGWPVVDPSTVAPTAVDVLLASARRDGAALTLVALGPVTNVALAVERDATAMRAIGRVVVMAGAVDVPGNVTPTAEFNAHVDPEALAEVLGAGLRVDLVPLDATRQAVLEHARLAVAVMASRDPVAAQVERFTARGFRVDAARGTEGMVLHDPLAVGVALEPALVTWEPARLDVGRDGQTRRGAGAPNCRVAGTVDRERFVASFLGCLFAAVRA